MRAALVFVSSLLIVLSLKTENRKLKTALKVLYLDKGYAVVLASSVQRVRPQRLLL